MSIRRSNRITARFEEAAREEAAVAARGHGRGQGRGRGRGRAPAPTPSAGRGKGAAPAAQAPQQHQGQAEEEDDEDEEVDEEIEVEQPSQHQQAPPPPPPLPNLVEVMAAQTQWMQCLTQIAEQGVQDRGPHPTPGGKPAPEDREIHPSEGADVQLLGGPDGRRRLAQGH